MKDYDSRELTDALTTDEVFIQYKLAQGPQLCMVLNEKMGPKERFACAKWYYVFSDIVENKEREIVLVGATKNSESVDPLKTFKAFRRPVKPNYFEDEQVEVNGLTYQLFKRFTPADIIGVLSSTFDVRQISYQLEDRMAVFCHYYNQENAAHLEGKVISQLEPILISREN